MRNIYQAILFAPDGECVKDFKNSPSKQDVWNKIADMGSRWIFYPIPFVATDLTIVDTPEGLEHLKGKRIATIKKHIAAADQDKLCQYLNKGWPLQDII